MQIIASSVQKVGESFLHFGYVSADFMQPPVVPYYMLPLLIAGVSFIGVACIFEFCGRRFSIRKRTAAFIAVGVGIIFLLIAAVVLTLIPVGPPILYGFFG